MEIERYTELRGAGREGSVDRWSAIDSLTRERVSLWTTPVTDADAAGALRAEAARLRQRGVEARVFEDLRRGLVGLAFGGPVGAGPTRPETRLVATQIGDPPVASIAPAVSGAAPPRGRGRVVLLVAGLLALAGASTFVAWWAFGRRPAQPDDATAGADALAPSAAPSSRTSPSPRPVRPTATWRTTPPSEPSADAAERCGPDIAIATGCIDRAPVLEADARACATCPPPTSATDVIGGDAATRRGMETEFAACDVRRAVTPNGSARCAAFDVASAYCAARGARVPTEAEWQEGATAGMATEPDLYEWTRDVVRERMNWTRGARGRSQADRHVRSPTLGFRCIR